jgi:hypothetical protein
LKLDQEDVAAEVKAPPAPDPEKAAVYDRQKAQGGVFRLRR